MKITDTTAYHDLDINFKKALVSNDLIKVWNNLTNIQRNEWVCYVTNAKKAETNKKRVDRALADLASGKKTPCCWPGCPHRRPQAAKWFK